MASFALITEGITDQAVLENILTGIYGDDVEVTILQPLRDATDESRTQKDSFGGWERVFEYCRLQSFDEVFMFNDYVIIQIDTDRAEDKHFGIPLTCQGQDRPVDELVIAVQDLLLAQLPAEIRATHQSRFVFAIVVHSLECWLLPLYAKEPSHTQKTKNCAKQLEREATRLALTCDKEYRAYDKLSAPYRKHPELEKAKTHQPSLALFLNALPAL